jgi:hypothetical protein
VRGPATLETEHLLVGRARRRGNRAKAEAGADAGGTGVPTQPPELFVSPAPAAVGGSLSRAHAAMMVVTGSLPVTSWVPTARAADFWSGPGPSDSRRAAHRRPASSRPSDVPQTGPLREGRPGIARCAHRWLPSDVAWSVTRTTSGQRAANHVGWLEVGPV